MASFHSKTFTKHDDYMTPKSAWENINQFIPKDKVIWEPFYCKHSKSADYLTELGCKEVIMNNEDFFKNNRGEVIISNPPFTMKKQVLQRLKQLNKPFIMIMPCSTISTMYVRELFKDCEDKLQVIIPRKRIQFIKVKDDAIVNEKGKCNFDCFYFCWKMNLPRDIVWLE